MVVEALDSGHGGGVLENLSKLSNLVNGCEHEAFSFLFHITILFRFGKCLVDSDRMQYPSDAYTYMKS